MKILYISLAPHVTAPRQRVRADGVISALKRLGHQVSTFACSGVLPQGWARALFTDQSPRLVSVVVLQALYVLFDLILCIKISVLKPDVVYERYTPLRGRPMFRGLFKGRYIVEYDVLPTDGLSCNRARASIDAADTLVFVSEEARTAFFDRIGAAPLEHAVVVPDAVDASKFQLPEQRAAAPFRVVFAGTLSADQRLDLLLAAIARMGRASKVEVTILGDGDQLANLRAICADLGLSARVKLPGQVSHDQVIAEMLRSHCGYAVQSQAAAASKTPALPLKVYEYLAAGLPVMARWQEDGLPLAKQLGTQSLLCDLTAEGVHLAIEAAVQVFSDDDVTAAFARRAHELAKSEHSWERRMRTLIGVAT